MEKLEFRPSWRQSWPYSLTIGKWTACVQWDLAHKGKQSLRLIRRRSPISNWCYTSLRIFGMLFSFGHNFETCECYGEFE